MGLEQIAANALSHNGYHDGQGYDEPVPWNQWENGVAWCADFACAMAQDAGYKMPAWGGPYGFQYVPTGWYNAQRMGATCSSWQAPVGSFAIFNWNGDRAPLGGSSHIEVVTGYDGTYLWTCGGNSGPSNVDGFRGTGGVHRHKWYAPPGVGNSLIQGIVLPDKIATSVAPPPPPPAPAPKPSAGRFDGWPQLQLGYKDRIVGPALVGIDKSLPVHSVQNALNILYKHENPRDPARLTVDGDYGPATQHVVWDLQNKVFNRDGKSPGQVDGVVGPHTYLLIGFLLTAMGR